MLTASRPLPHENDTFADRAHELVSAMTPEERFGLVCGNHLGLRAIPRLGLSAVHFIDASNGIRIVGEYATANCEKTLSHPCTLLLSCTWNPDLVRRHARALGEECRAHGIHVLLGPGINFSRTPVNGRNFEYAGEDPHVTSVYARAFVDGLQSTGTGATIKHFVGNETDHLRRSSNSIIDERALNEVYLAPFRSGIAVAPFAVMTAYNMLENEWCGESHYVNQVLLRDKLGFNGLVMTDWYASWHGEKLAASGCDLEMPRGEALIRDKERLLGSPAIDRMASSIVRACLAFGFYEADYKRPDLFARRPQWGLTARQVNEEGIVLLKNDGVLPLSSDCVSASRRILVTGNAARRQVLAGGGSAFVKGYDSLTYLAALQAQFAPPLPPGAPIGQVDGQKSSSPANTSPVVFVEKPTDKDIREADLVLVFTGFNDSEADHSYEGEDRIRPFDLPQQDLLRRCTRLNRHTIVILACVGGSAALPWANDAAAILHTLYGGQTGAQALVDILTGRTNPSGKLTFTMGLHEEDAPSFGDDKTIPRLHAPEPGFGQRLQSSCRNNFAWTGGHDGQGTALVYDVFYKEGVFIGHRWYDWHQLPVHFPFGHGLSYTTFSYGDPLVELTGDAASPDDASTTLVRIRLSITNTGPRDGAEVLQLYVADQSQTLPRPPRELKSFQKIRLASGESREVTFELNARAFRYWNSLTHAWACAPGPFEIQIGSSSRDIRCTTTLPRLPTTT